MEQKSGRDSVIEHYGKDDLLSKVREALQRAFGTDAKLSASDLNALDQFHVGGLKSTAELLQAMHISRGHQVLDIGSGLGGPARHAAKEFGASVTGIDLNTSFVELAKMLGDGEVDFQQADATELPFADQSFDRVYTQHVSMNIADRAKLYADIHRVLKPDGLFGFFDVLSGGKGPLTYPVPWASQPEISFLFDDLKTRELITEQGFKEVSWTDKTTTGIAGLQKQIEMQKLGGTSALNLTLVMGPQFALMASNLVHNLVDGRAKLVQAIFER